MSQAVSLSIPCLGTSQPYYTGERVTAPRLHTIAKVALVVFAIFAGAALGFLICYLSPVAGACLVAAVALWQLVAALRTPKPSFGIQKLESLEAAKQLAAGIDTTPALQHELRQIIPNIDAMRADGRIASLQYHCDKTATFALKTAPHLQFRISAPTKRSWACEEFYLTRRYENRVYAQAICHAEHYDSLRVPSVKPLYLTVGGLHRLALVEQVVQKARLPAKDLERAVRQMVQFLLKTGGGCYHVDPIPFTPLAGGKLALHDLHHLTESPHPDDEVRKGCEVRSVLDQRNSLLASLDSEELIDIALDELRKQRPVSHRDPTERGVERRLREIQRAKEARLAQLRNPAPVPVPTRAAPPRNILRITPEELGLDLSARDYAVIRHEGVHSDGVCRIITLREVAQAILDRINRKLEENPTRAKIEFTPEEMLIGEKLPSFTWEKHYEYNTLQGLGYREWPDPNQEPPYWMALVLQSLKNKGLVANFTLSPILPEEPGPQVTVNLRALAR